MLILSLEVSSPNMVEFLNTKKIKHETAKRG
jgi:hypothetical protein